MTRPNLLIVGAQKCGTTWLHECLAKSPQVFAAVPKELNFFNQADWLRHVADYEGHFWAQGATDWRLESTPHYFRLPERGLDVAARIHDMLGEDVRVLVMLRDPVERYLSSYTHHMMQGRFPYRPVIDDARDDYRMLALGDYASILRHWQRFFPDMGVFFYDDLVRDAKAHVSRVFEWMGATNDLPPGATGFETNAKRNKVSHLKSDPDWVSLPVLSDALRRQLATYYRAEVLDLQMDTGRDLSDWNSLQS